MITSPLTCVFLQLIEAFGGMDLTVSLNISGQLASLDEYWASELCFKMVRVGSKEGVGGLRLQQDILVIYSSLFVCQLG